jgi:hypothetical protein
VNRRFILATALFIPALAFVSCKDDGNSNPVEPQVNTPQAQTPSYVKSKVNVGSIRLPASSAQAKAEAAKIESGATLMTAGAAPHDPTLFLGSSVACFGGDQVDDGNPATTYTGTSFRFANGRGCENNTLDPGPDGSVAIVTPTVSTVNGKLLDHTTRLEFTYAGGPPIGGSPRFSLFVDTCQPNDGQITVTHDCQSANPGSPGSSTDGVWDETVFIDNNNCNDGDGYVGTVAAKSTAGKTDATCTIFFQGANGSGSYPNWATYVANRTGARWARWFDDAHTQAVENFIIDDQPQHYLIYRVFIRARL